MKSLLLVCHLNPRKWGTFEKYLAALADYGRQRGVRVGAVFSGEPIPAVADEFRAAGLEWFAVPDWSDAADRENPAAFVRGYLAALRNGPWDVAVFQFCSELGVVRGAVAARLRRLAPRAAVWVQHSQMRMPGRLGRHLSRFRLLRPVIDRVIVLSDAAKRSAEARGWPVDRVVVIRNGIPPLPPERKGWLRLALGLPMDATILLSVGSLIHRKGFDVLLPAVAPLLGDSPPRHLVIAGDGPDRASLVALADSLAVTSFVHFLGLRDDVPDLLADADLFVLASRAEGLTLAVVEAMARGLPVVVTAVGGHAEVVPPAAGRLVPPGDVGALAAALKAMVAELPVARAAAVDRVGQVMCDFSLSRQVERQWAVFDALEGVP